MPTVSIRRRATIGALAATMLISGAMPAAAAGPDTPAGSYTIKGSGASFPAPAYYYWFPKFKSSLPNNVNATMQYGAIGSGGGISDFKNGLNDYGASDRPLNFPSGQNDGIDLDTMVHVPAMIGAVALGVKLDCVSTLTLTGDNVGDLYSGSIKRWNDAKLRTNGRNPGLASCDIKVTPVHRSDSSGTTFAFTSYLKQSTNGYWAGRSQLPSNQISWPVGPGAPRNSGVALKVKNTNGGIGYVELSYANSASLIKAKVENPRGAFVTPTSAATTASANAKLGDVPNDLRIAPVISANCLSCYPIVTYTFWLVRKENKDSADEGKVMLAYFYWGLTSGQSYLSALGYAKLPSSVKTKAINQLGKVEKNGTKLCPSC